MDVPTSQCVNWEKWLLLDGIQSIHFLGAKDGTAWRRITPQGSLSDARVCMLKAGANMYAYNLTQQQIQYAPISNLNNWTTIPLLVGFPQAWSGRIIADATYLYSAGYSTGSLQRSTLPSANFTDVSSSNGNARGSGLSKHKTFLYSVRNASGQDVYRSSDSGVNWSLIGSISHFPAGYVYFSSNGTRLVACYQRASDSKMVCEYSDNDGATWSGVVYTFPVTGDTDQWGTGVLHTGTHFVVALTTGQNAHSANGASWTAGATIPRNYRNLSSGDGIIVAGCSHNSLYKTENNGLTWEDFPSPVARNSDPSGWIYCHWIV